MVNDQFSPLYSAVSSIKYLRNDKSQTATCTQCIQCIILFKGTSCVTKLYTLLHTLLHSIMHFYTKQIQCLSYITLVYTVQRDLLARENFDENSKLSPR